MHCVFWEMKAITALINIQQNVITSAHLQVIFLIHKASSYKDTLITCRKSKTNKNTAGKAYF